MDATPAVIRITDLRRSTTEVVNEMIHSGRPVFVTQHGYVTAVLLSREQYDDLSHARRRQNESDRSASRSGRRTRSPPGNHDKPQSRSMRG